MTETRFWLIRHALVEENARAIVYGTMDVELCPHTLEAQVPMYVALARRLPRPATWLSSPLSRAQRTGAAIFAAGYPDQVLTIVPGLIELGFGEWQGQPHADVAAQLTIPPHAFWPLAGAERPPGGESMADGIQRVGAATMEALAREYRGRDVVASAMAARSGPRRPRGRPDRRQRAALLDREHLPHPPRPHPAGWRVACVNELPGV